VVLRAGCRPAQRDRPFVFPILKGGYFPGLYTAGGQLVMSALLLYFLIQESRRAKARDGA
jgi:hypothetical protein